MDTTESQRHGGIVNRSAPTATIVPVLIYEDLGKAIDWLCVAFGFTERLRAGRDGRVTHAQLSVGECAVMLGAQGAEFRPPRSNEVNQYVLVHVEDVDRHFEHAKHSGARIVHPPTNMPFGERPYTAEDFAGHRWTFSQSIADVAPEQWGRYGSQTEVVRIMQHAAQLWTRTLNALISRSFLVSLPRASEDLRV